MRIDRIGIELEGGWDAPEPFPSDQETILTSDESLTNGVKNNHGKNCRHFGEVNTKPPIKLEELDSWMHLHYPEYIFLPSIDNSPDGTGGCGLHIHLSFLSKDDYAILGSQSFNSYFLKEMEKELKEYKGDEVAHIKHRLLGRNKFCRRVMRPHEQVPIEHKDNNARPLRRRQLNFCYKMHKTVEIRLLPMFYDVNDAIRWIKKVILIFESWLELAHASGLAARLLARRFEVRV